MNISRVYFRFNIYFHLKHGKLHAYKNTIRDFQLLYS